jgi:hypothetical protein
MMAIKSAPQSASPADAPCSAGQSGFMSRFRKLGTEDIDPCDRRRICQRRQGFIRSAQRNPPRKMGIASGIVFAPEFRGLSEGFVESKHLVAAASGSCHQWCAEA